MKNTFKWLTSRHRIRLAVVAAGTLLTRSGLFAVPAAQAAVQPNAQPSWCGWHPANDSGDPGWITYDVVNIRTGQGTQCNVIGTGSNGDYVVVHCYAINGAGELWYYIWDSANSTTGWVIGNSVLPVWDAEAC